MKLTKRKNAEYSRATILADAVGLTHLLVATGIVIVGEYTDIFNHVGGRYHGIQFVYKFIDWPIVRLLTPILDWFGVGGDVVDRGLAMVTAGFVIAASSAIYGIITYYVARFIGSLIASDN